MNLDFIILYVSDMDKVKAFYIDILDLSVVKEASGPNFITLRSGGGAMLGLQDKAGAQFAPRDETHSGSVELSFSVDDVDATWKHWKENGVEVLSDPTDLPFGRYFIAKDPEGHYLSAYRFAR